MPVGGGNDLDLRAIGGTFERKHVITTAMALAIVSKKYCSELIVWIFLKKKYKTQFISFYRKHSLEVIVAMVIVASKPMYVLRLLSSY